VFTTGLFTEVLFCLLNWPQQASTDWMRTDGS